MCIFIKNCTFSPLADAQRAHSASRAYGRPPVGTRLRQTSGRDAPTAFPTKANGEEFAFRSTGEALQKQGKNLHKGNHRSPTTCKK